ncbi:OmpH family outer membrane protein [Alistipes sp. ZOR0009]|jgi:outer membrane protein|uniref:OmpH family outer membrane protein n=1 Tax=Alistipes sp. ZOR0009 TaxID=1339253 RepID=UPI000690E829|nr:OmpH family outer membrane protein [Alistipes sp. ZOR0009]
MKKGALIFYVIISVAVVALYVLFFVKGGSSEPQVVAPAGSNGGTIAYVNIDTLVAKYDMATDLNKKLEDKTKKIEADFGSKVQSFQREAVDFQDKAQKGLITRSQAEDMQGKLQQKQQSLSQQENQYRMQLAEEQQVALRNIHAKIVEFLQEYNKTKGYSMIISTTLYGGPVLVGNKALDITSDVVKGLNSKYDSSK